MLREYIRHKIKKAIQEKFDGIEVPDFSVEVPEESKHGDYATNAALLLSKTLKKNPMEIALFLVEKLRSYRGVASVAKVEVEPPGFINFWLEPSMLYNELAAVLKQREKYGRFLNKKHKINVEFVSANPTGPLTMANGRGGFFGDVLANVLERAGYKVVREYFINDAGNQIRLLGESILAAEGKIPFKEEYYKGAYIKELAGKTASEAVEILLGKIKSSLKKAGIKFDVWFSEEKNLRRGGKIKKVLELLQRQGVLRESEGALWFDEHVVVKSDSEPTYFLVDLAYHYDKFIKRKFDTVINIWGADHHGSAERLRKGIARFGVEPERLKIILMQLVRLIRDGKEVKMGKRTGEFVTLDELLEEVGVDAARWFFLERSPATHIDFDLDLAKERSMKNPVYYVQYAHARMAGIFEKFKIKSVGRKITPQELRFLKQEEEISLIKKLIRSPEVVEETAKDYQVHRLTRYAYEVSRAFHNFYERHRVLSEDKELMYARLALVEAAQIVLQNTLMLLGISAPNKM